jgi:hypothetical protein
VRCYASRTGTRRNLAVLRAAGWRLFVSRVGVWRTEGMPFAADNGAWADYQAKRDFDEDAYDRFLDWLAAQLTLPDFIVLPDIVAGGQASLDLSMRYLNRCLSLAPLVLIAVQDGMEHQHLEPLVGPNVGIFLGGSTEWKIARMQDWGAFCAALEVYYHVARVNTRRRMYQAIAAGAHSIDGSSCSRYAVTMERLDHASRHRDLFAPRLTYLR